MVIELDIVDIFRNMREGIDMDLPFSILPCQVGNMEGLDPFFDAVHQHGERFFRRVAAQDIIDMGVADKLFVKVGGRKPSEDNRNVRMILLQPFGHLDASVCMREPVKVYPESACPERPEHLLRIVSLSVQHPHGQIDDPEKSDYGGYFPEEISGAAQEVYDERIPAEYRDVIKEYFKKINQ